MKCPKCGKEITRTEPTGRPGWVHGYCDCTPGKAVIRNKPDKTEKPGRKYEKRTQGGKGHSSEAETTAEVE